MLINLALTELAFVVERWQDIFTAIYHAIDQDRTDTRVGLKCLQIILSQAQMVYITENNCKNTKTESSK